ncbi:MAG: LptF/LptG family permease, partial [Bacteroidota bacterium]
MILYKHILRAHIGPFLFSFLTLVFVFLLQFLIKQLDQLVGKGLSVWVILELITLSLAWIVVLAVPMSVLVATLMAFGSMASNSEVTAMKASGVSLYRMMAPVIVVALLVAFLLVEFNNNVLPDANHKVATLLRDIRRKKPTLTLQPGVFSQDIQGYSILVRKTFEDSNDLEDVTLYDYTTPNLSVVITARRGAISFSPDYRKLVLNLQEGEIHRMDLSEENSYRRITFEKHRLVMNAKGFEFERSSENAFIRGDRELSAREMLQRTDSLRHQNEEARQRVEKWKSRHFKQFYADSIVAIPPHMPSPPPLTEQWYTSAIRRSQTTRSTIRTEESRINYNARHINSYMV